MLRGRSFPAGRRRPLSFRGFTLVEIMVVVTIVALLAAVSVPMLTRYRMNAVETVVLGSCQTIGKACQNFYSNAMPHTYPDTLSRLATDSPSYIDSVLGGGQKQGYRFTYTLLDPEHFQLQAEPITPGWHGTRFFFLDETGVLRSRVGESAGPADIPVGGV